MKKKSICVLIATTLSTATTMALGTWVLFLGFLLALSPGFRPYARASSSMVELRTFNP